MLKPAGEAIKVTQSGSVTHTILDERLGISENKAMKVLISETIPKIMDKIPLYAKAYGAIK